MLSATPLPNNDAPSSPSGWSTYELRTHTGIWPPPSISPFSNSATVINNPYKDKVTQSNSKLAINVIIQSPNDCRKQIIDPSVFSKNMGSPPMRSHELNCQQQSRRYRCISNEVIDIKSKQGYLSRPVGGNICYNKNSSFPGHVNNSNSTQLNSFNLSSSYNKHEYPDSEISEFEYGMSNSYDPPTTLHHSPEQDSSVSRRWLLRSLSRNLSRFSFKPHSHSERRSPPSRVDANQSRCSTSAPLYDNNMSQKLGLPNYVLMKTSSNSILPTNLSCPLKSGAVHAPPNHNPFANHRSAFVKGQ